MIYKPTTNLDNATLDGTKTNSFILNAPTSGESIQGYKIKIKDLLNNTDVYESDYIPITSTTAYELPANVMVNGRDYEVTIRVYNELESSEATYNTTISRGKILGSTNKLFLVHIPKDDTLAKSIPLMISEFYGGYIKENDDISQKLNEYITFTLPSYSDGIRRMVYNIILNHNDLNTEAEIQSVLEAQEKEIFDKLKYDRFAEIDLSSSEYKDRIISEELPTTDVYEQRCRIDWVTNKLGDSKEWAIVELSDDKIDTEREGFNYSFTDQTVFNLYNVSGLHTVNSFFVDPDIINKLKLGNMVLIYKDAETAMKARAAGDTPTQITVKPIYPKAYRIIGLSSDTGEVRIQGSFAFAPKNGYIPRFFALETDVYEEIKVGKDVEQETSYHVKAGSYMYKDKFTPSDKYPYFGSETINILNEMQGSGWSYGTNFMYPSQPNHIGNRGSTTIPFLLNPGGLPTYYTHTVLAGRVRNGKTERWYRGFQVKEACEDTELADHIRIVRVAFSIDEGGMITGKTPMEIKTEIESIILETYESGRYKYCCTAYNKNGDSFTCYATTDCTKELLAFNPISYKKTILGDRGQIDEIYDLSFNSTKISPCSFNQFVGVYIHTCTSSVCNIELKEKLKNNLKRKEYSYGDQVYYDYECRYPKNKLGYSYRRIDTTTSKLTNLKDVYLRTPETFDCYAFTPYYQDKELTTLVNYVPKHTTLTATLLDMFVSTITIGGITYYIRTPKVSQTQAPILYKDKDLKTKIGSKPKGKGYVQVSPRTSAIHELAKASGYYWDIPMLKEIQNPIYGLYGNDQYIVLTADKIYDLDVNECLEYPNPGFTKIWYGTGKFVSYINSNLYYSYDLINWIPISFDSDISFVYYFGGRWLVSIKGESYLSEDGLTFTEIKINDTSIGTIVDATHANDHYWITVDTTVYRSTNCISWTNISEGYTNLLNISGMLYCYGLPRNSIYDTDGHFYDSITPVLSVSSYYPILDYCILNGSSKQCVSGYYGSDTKGARIIDYDSGTYSGIYCMPDYDNFAPTQTIPVVAGETTTLAYYDGSSAAEIDRYNHIRSAGVSGEVMNLKTTKVGDYYVSTPLYAKDSRRSTRVYKRIANSNAAKICNLQDAGGEIGYIEAPLTDIAPTGTAYYLDSSLTTKVGDTTFPVNYIIDSNTGLCTTSLTKEGEEQTIGATSIYYIATPQTGSIKIGTPIYSDMELTNLIGNYKETISINNEPCIHLIVPEALEVSLYDPNKTYEHGDQVAKIMEYGNDMVTQEEYLGKHSLLCLYEYQEDWGWVSQGRPAYRYATEETLGDINDGEVFIYDPSLSSDSAYQTKTATFTAVGASQVRLDSGKEWISTPIGRTAEEHYSMNENWKSAAGVSTSNAGFAQYIFDFAIIPHRATNIKISCKIYGHAESSTHDYSTGGKYSHWQFYLAGSTKGSYVYTTSTTNTEITMTVADCGYWTREQLNNLQLRNYVGSYGGGASGITVTVTWTEEVLHIPGYTKFVRKVGSSYEDYTGEYYWIDDNYNKVYNVTDITMSPRFGELYIIYRGLFLDPELNVQYVPITGGDNDKQLIHLACYDSNIREVPANQYNDYERTYIADGLIYKISTSMDGSGLAPYFRFRLPDYIELEGLADRTFRYRLTNPVEFLGQNNYRGYRFVTLKTWIDSIQAYRYLKLENDDFVDLVCNCDGVKFAPEDITIDYIHKLDNDILSAKIKIDDVIWNVAPRDIEEDVVAIEVTETKYNEQRLGGNPIDSFVIQSNNDNRLFINENELILQDKTNSMEALFNNGTVVKLKTPKKKFNKVGAMYLIDNIEKLNGDIPRDAYDHIEPETRYTIRTCFQDQTPGSKVFARNDISVSIQVQDYFQPAGFNEITGSLNYRDIEFKCFTDFIKGQGISINTVEWTLSKDDEVVKESGKVYDPTETWLVRGLVNGNYNITATVNSIYTASVDFTVSFSDTPEDFVKISYVPEDCEYPEGISSPAMKLLLKKGDKDHRIYSIFKLGVYDEVYRFIESIEVDTNKDVIFYDYNVANGEYFKYFVYRDEPDVVGYKTCETEWTQFCEPVAYWLDELEEDVEETDTYKVKKSLKMYLTPNSGSLTVNQGNTWQDTITKYGLLTKSNKNYHSGNLSVLAGEVVDGVYVDKVDEYKEILLSNNLKLLRTPKGERFVIAVTGAPTLDTNYVSNLMQTTITIPWSEVEDSEKITVYSYKLGEGLIPENAVAFASLTPFTVQLDGNKWYGEGTLEYSLDNINWTTYPNDGTSVLPTPAIKNGEEYYMIYLRGVGNTRTYHYDEETSTDYGTYFVTTGTFNLLGKFNNLLDYTASSVSCDSCCYLFYDTGVVDASDFIMSDNLATITTYNYYGMFYNCSSLTTPPQLPAMALANSCYNIMFLNCTALTTPPELPATTLDNSCYNRMFQNCYSLKTAPELPATTLTYGCYFRMFDGCESLTIAPELPATTLTLTCYNYMFNNCISLTTPPSTLPATQLATSCYDNMFYGCTNLAAVPDMTITKNGVSACYQMFFNCESIKTANNIIIQHANAKNCCEQMFYGCTSLETPPQLPATSLHEGCYESMFNGCASLITAPALPATYMYNNCYAYMFQDCTSLTTPPPSLPATSLSYQCYRMMFVGCSSLTDIPSFAPSALAPSGVTNYSCWFMFQNCSSLRINTTATTKGKFVAPSEVPIGSARGMFSGVAEFPESEGVPVAGTTYYAQ